MARVAKKNTSRLNRRMAIAVASCFAAAAHANPTGPTVTAGSATFSTLGNTLNVSNVPGTIIRWQGFSIQANEITRFLQQNSQSAVLNRVTGGNMSLLLGQLLSNGRVFLINPSGIVVGQGAVIDVAALVASSLNLSDADFLAGRYRFTGQPGTGSIVNQGTITTPAGGHVYLVAPKVENHGIITSPSGQVILAAGKTVELVSPASPQLRVEITAPEGEAVNLGDIVSQAGRVGIYGASVRNSGRVSANSAVVGENGKIVFKATKDVTLADGSRVEAKNSAGKGGTVEVQGDRVALTGDASIDVSGKTGGGTVLVGGDYAGKNPDVQNASGTFLGSGTSIRADALESGDGGKVIVWSNDATRVHGSISARGAGGGSGGFVETSSHGYLEVTRAPELSIGGTWLLDPYNITVVAGAGTSNNSGAPDFTPGNDSEIGADLITGQLNTGASVTLDTTGDGLGLQAGDITVNAAIIKTVVNSASLTLNAANDIGINASVVNNGGAFNVTAGGDLTVTKNVVATGMDLSVGGALSVVGTSSLPAQLLSTAGQTITAKSVLVSAQGTSAQILNQAGGSQTITVNGGGSSAGIDVQAIVAGGVATISNTAPGGAQTIIVKDADHIRVKGETGAATIAASGPQTISITGAASANRIELGSFSANSVSQISGRNQLITAGLLGQNGGITIIGTNMVNASGPNTLGILGANVAGSTQTINTSGVVSLVGGAAANPAPPPPPALAQTSNAGIFQNANADQTINAAGIELVGGSGGNNNSVLINSNGQQFLNVSGNIGITGGEVGASNRANMQSTVRQEIHAGSITLTSGSTGFENSAGLSAPTQDIYTTGNVEMNGSSSTGVFNGTRIGGLGGNAPSSTDLFMDIGGSLLMNGGSATNNGASIGSTAPTAPNPAPPSTIEIHADGDVIMTSGTGAGARIGTTILAAPVAGDVLITAGGSIQLNGTAHPTAIRTTGNVSLSATSISENTNGFILANKLSLTTTSGDANLMGPNQVLSLVAGSYTPDLVPVPVSDIAGSLNFRNTGDLSVTGVVSSVGAMTLDVEGTLSVSASGAQRLATVHSTGGQTIDARSISVTAQDGNYASIKNELAGDQTISVAGGAGIDVRVLGLSGGQAEILGVGNAQIITATDSDHINVSAQSGAADIIGGVAQTISITGSGANQINLGAAGNLGHSGIAGATQTVTAGTSLEAGGINLVGADSLTSVGFNTFTAAAENTQTISTTGTISITGGNAANTSAATSASVTQIAHFSHGTQTINARGIEVRGGAGGDIFAVPVATGGNIARIVSSGGGAISNAGNQVINVGAGGLQVNGGTNGINNSANVTGWAGQTINASTISLTSGASGIDNSAVIGGATQTITTTGDVLLSGNSGTGAASGVRIGGAAGGIIGQPPLATNLTLNVGNNLIMTGGSAPNNGPGLGSTVTATALANNITVVAGGSVILNEGSAAGARIGTPNAAPTPAAGTISITANSGSIELNGNIHPTSIRTSGDVTLRANSGSISEGANGFIQANRLTLRSAGNANLAGPNQVSILSAPFVPVPPPPPGAVIAGVGGSLTFSNVGDLNVDGTVSSQGLMSVTATGALNVNGNGLQNAELVSFGGQNITAQSVNLTASNNRRSNIENRGIGNQSITATAGGMNLQALGGSGVAQIINNAPGASQTLSMTGLLNVLGGTTTVGSRNSGVFQNVVGSQSVTSSGIVLQATNTGTPAAPSGAIISSGGDQTINAGSGNVSMASAAGGNASITAGSATNQAAIQTITAHDISLANGTGGINGAATILAPHQTINATGNVTLTAQAGVVTPGNLAGIRIGGNGTPGTDLTMTVGGNLTLTGGSLQDNAASIGSSGAGVAGANTITITAGSVTLTGGTAPGSVARIGTAPTQAPAAGNISITTTGGGIQLDGTTQTAAIRTAGNVTLSAASMSETGNAFIAANKLTLQASGNADLGGPNQVSFLSAPNVPAAPPAPPGTFAPGVGGSLTFNNTQSLSIADTVSSGGPMTLNVAGDIAVLAGAGQDISVRSFSGQTINARSLAITSQDGGRVQLWNTAGDQTISLTGGTGLDVQTLGLPGLGGFANVINDVSGNQTITVTDGQRIGVNGAAGSASVLSFGGTQDISITGTGANAITVGSSGAVGSSNFGGMSQSITAGLSGQSGSISILGPTVAPGGSPAIAGIVSNPVAGGTQTVSTSGTLSVTAGSSPSHPGGFQTGIFHNGSGQQTIGAGDIVLQGGAAGSNNTAFISSQGNPAALTAGDQLINVTRDISISGAAGGNASISGSRNKLQTINARSISLTNALTGGNNSAGTIVGSTQVITATGNVTLSANAANGSNTGARIGGGTYTVSGVSTNAPTNLTLNVTGDLLLSGGTAPNNGAGIGSASSGTSEANNINITTGGSVILNSGSAPGAGTRIGSSLFLPTVAGGDISIAAGGDIQLNGNAGAVAAIRTTGDVSLSAVNMSESANGLVLANKLTLKATGNANLGGSNLVSILSAPDTLLPPPPPPLPPIPGTLPGVLGSLTFNNLGNLSVVDTVSSGGAMDLTVAGALNVNAGGTQDAFVRSTGGQTITAHSIGVTAQDSRSAFIDNFGPGSQTITVQGGGTGAGIDVRTLSSNGTARIFSGGAQTITVDGGDHINLDAAAGSALINSSGTQTISLTGSGANRIGVGSAGSAGLSQIIAARQNITAGTGSQAGRIDIVGSERVTTTNGIITFTQSGNAQTINTTGTIRIAAGSAANVPPPPPPTPGPSSSAGIFHNASGAQTINAGRIELLGGQGGNGNSALINSSGGNNLANAGNQVIDVGGELRITGGEAGIGNRASINGFAGQTIHAGSIAVTSGNTGVESSAAISGVTQAITTAGDLVMQGAGSTGTFTGTRIGGLGGAIVTATDLTMNVGGSLRMNGGSAPLNGASIGSTAPTAPAVAQPSKITITAGNDVIMTSGTGAGARIGTTILAAPVAGDVSITAGGSIQMNGTSQSTAIRTTGDVTLNAASISQASNGFILANALTTTSSGDTTLTGPNQVASFSGASTGGSVTLNNAGPVAIQGINAANAALIRAASVSGSGAISTGTGFTIDVALDSSLNGVISGAGGLNKDGVGALTLGAVNTYAGDTNVNVGTLALGAADQTTTGNINIAGGATFRGSPGTYTNAGVIAGNGTVDVAATSFTNSGTLRPGGAGAVGTLTVQGNAVINGTLDIEAQGAGVGNHDVLAVTGAATLGGALSVTPINGYAPGSGDTIVPLTFASRSGVLNVSPADWSATYNPANLTLVFGSSTNRWIAASGNWDLAANWSLGHVPTNFETVLIDVPGSQFVTVSHGAQAADKLTSFENFIISGGSLSLGGPSTFNGSLTLLGGSLKGGGDVSVNGAFIWAGGKLAGAGNFLTSASTVSLLSPLTGDLVLDRNWTNQGAAYWVNLRPGGKIAGSGSLQNEGTLSVEGRKAVLGAAFGNSGTLNVDTDLDLQHSQQNAGTINVAGGVKLEVHGTYTNLGRLAGKGTLDLDGGKLINLGTLAPGANGGNGIGTFTVLGDFQQGATGVLEIDLGGTHVGQYDVLDVNGKATLGGTLFMRAANGYAPRDGDDFKLLTYKSRVGTFEFVLPPAGFGVDADYGKKSATFELE